MKKIIILFFIALSVTASPVFAVDFMVGAKAGYYIWSPYFNDIPNSGIEDMGTGDGFLSGPVLSSMLTDDFTISVSALFGKQTGYWTDNNKEVTIGNSSFPASGSHYALMKRRDIDSAVSYRVTDTIKIIVGFKYQNIEMTYWETVIFYGPVNDTYHHHVVIDIPSYGPAFGIGYLLTFSDTLFATVNLNGLYMWSKLVYKENRMERYTPDGVDSFSKEVEPIENDSYNTRQMGFNLEPSIGLKAANNIIVTLGFRYQMLKTKFVDKFLIKTGGGGGVDLTPDGWLTDSIYGLFVSAIYVF